MRNLKKYLVKLSLLWNLMLIPLVLYGFTSYTNPNPVVESESVMYNNMIWVTNWIPSDPYGATYGKGHFFYRLSRSQYPIDNFGNYGYEVYFISNSFDLARHYQDLNNNGILDANEVYRVSTKIDRVTLYVNNRPHLNLLTNSTTFWLVFKGDYPSGRGDMKISFIHRGIISPRITWSQPRPY